MDQPTSEQLQQALVAARIRAEQLGLKVCVAVVDRAGNLAAFLRMPGAFLISSDLAIDKAWSSASFGLTTREIDAVLAQETEAVRSGLLRRPRLTVVPGGVPLLSEDRMIGAIGVSGGSADQDEDLARTAIASFTSGSTA